MKRCHVFGFGAGCFALGIVVQTAVAQNRKPVFAADLVQGKDPKAAATALLDGALQLAENGSWERIAVGRAYLGGDKARGQKILDEVTGGKKIAGSDWFRLKNASACGHAEPRTCKSEARHQRKFALGVGPRRQ